MSSIKHLYPMIIELYDSGLSITEIAKKVERPYPSITYILKKLRGYSNARPSQGDIHYFENIDTHAKAYLFGFIAADGNISIDKRKNLMNFTLVVNSKDRNVVEFLQSEIGFETKILDSTPFDKRTGKHYNRTSISLGNQKFCQHLFDKGIVPRKSMIIKDVSIYVPVDLRNSFVLGYFDGNGHVSLHSGSIKSIRLGISSGSIEILHGIANVLSIYDPQIHKNGNCHTLYIGKKHLTDTFYSFCYKDSPFWLKRKRDKFPQIFLQDETISSPPT